jgi:surface carbohydrate biosynthesis protein (TIGR04326 family)
MKRLKLVPKQLAAFLISKIININSVCYYLTDDVSHFLYLKNRFAGRIEIKNLSGLFDETFQKIKMPLLELISKLNEKYDSLEWWGGHLASRNSATTPLLLNITYLFCTKKILSNSERDLIFVINSQALSDCISDIAGEFGYQVKRYGGRIFGFIGIIRRWLLYIAQLLYFFWQSVQRRRAAFKLLKPLSIKKTSAKKKVVIRTWITKGTFDGSGRFKDRNFGQLPAWLRYQNYEVLTLPMFFNLPGSIKEMYKLIKNREEPFLIPDHYLKCSDYLKILYDDYRLLRKRVENAAIEEIDVAPLFNEVLKNQGFLPHLSTLNLCYPMFKRLKEMGFEIDAFYYPFENNAPEKQFILGCRKYFPNSQIIGFQHTTFFPNQLAYHLAPVEKDYHPLPDKIVCSGPIYVKLHNEAGFPSEILVAGPNLRFESVYIEKAEVKNSGGNQKKMLLLPLTFSYDLALELFVKTREALKDVLDYQVYIRSHPLLSKKTLIEFLNKIGMSNYEFADDGIIQNWLVKSYAVISTGASITILEAVSMGTPVIRVIPDNTFFYDPFTWPDYPLEPVNSSSEIRRQLELIDEIQDKEMFQNIAKEVMSEYFTKPNEENLKVFL